MNAWDHLPNAALIDRVIAHAKAYPEKWRGAWDAAFSQEAARDASWEAARGTARDAAWHTGREAAWNASWYAAWDAAWYAAGDVAWETAREAARGARYACYALVAWDDCGYLLDYTPEQLQALLTIDPTYHPARLLLPAVVAMNPTNQPS